MTNQTPPHSPSPRERDERQDELIAVLIALGAIGTIFFWGFNRIGNATKFAAQLEGNPIATAVDGDQDSLDVNDDNDNGGGFFRPVDVADDDGNGDRPVTNGGTNTNAGQTNTPGLGPVSTVVGGSVLVNSDRPDTDATDSETASAEVEGTDVEGTDVEGIDVEGIDVEGTDVEGTDVEGTDVEGTDVEGTDVEGTDVDAPVASTEEEEIASDVETDDTRASDVAEVELSDLATDVPAEEFSDIDQDYWARPFIEGLRKNDVVTGFEGGNFAPDSPVSRSQFAAQLYRASQQYEAFAQDENVAALFYSDIPASHPQADAIGLATKTGFMRGYPEGDFRPNDKVSKLEVLIALTSGLKLTVPDNPEDVLRDYYGDASDIPEWAVPKMAAATDAGLVVNYNDLRSLNSSRPATRAEAAAMLYQALVNLGETSEVESDYIVVPQ